MKPLTNVTRVDRDEGEGAVLREPEKRQRREEKRQRLAALEEQLESPRNYSLTFCKIQWIFSLTAFLLTLQRAIEEQLEAEQHLVEETEAMLQRTQERELVFAGRTTRSKRRAGKGRSAVRRAATGL
jgi:hypothetical protein